jgi:hypothetical protein
MEEIELLSIYEMQSSPILGNDYYEHDYPSATPENMLILLNKINELTERINELTIK